ncbi:hypothetical protein [Anaerorhabdus sp.]|uniref:hypothetical protein n=1 Tax=Anaerorhabdus sp. TaxID=1872524 RepID=UPI002FC781C8
MKLNRNSLQRFNICAILYFVYICFFYEKNLFGGIFFQISRVLIWVFLLILIYESFSAGYHEQILFIVLMFVILALFYYIDTSVSSATVWGFGLFELNRTLFTLPLSYYQSLNEVVFIMVSVGSFILGYAVKLIKNYVLVTKANKDVTNEIKPTK